MASAFRREGSAVVGRLAREEREIVTGLMASTRDLLDPDDQESSGDVFADLMRQLDKPAATDEEVAGRDPALQRLLPPASRDDSRLARDFRALTEDSLRQRKVDNLTTAIQAMDAEASGRLELDLQQAQAVMIALTDVRLVLGERLGIRTDEESDQLHALVGAGLEQGLDDPWILAAVVYDLLTTLQESVALALLERPQPTPGSPHYDQAIMTAPDTSAALPSTPRTRVAPSPTGDPHVGTAYMAMFDLAFARRHGGQFVLRIEDTDRNRFVEGSEQQVFDTLAWLGLGHDEGPDVGGPYAPYRQSERLDTYRPYAEKLLEEGKAYYCWCTSERLAEMRQKQQALKQPTGYDRLCHGKTEEERRALPGFSEKPVVRMLIPDDVELEFDDLIMGRTSAPRPDDQVILKADGFPTYHLAVVVDDHEMGITHVVRGQEWISSTPKHILLYNWLGLPIPAFAHMPLLRDEKRAKISKRKNPWARLTWFKEEGYLPEALLNFLALQGYPPIIEADGTEREVFDFAEFTERFDWSKMNKAGAVFNLDKLDWLNGHYIRELEVGDLAARVRPYLQHDGVLSDDPSLPELSRLKAVTELIQTRIVKLTDATALVAPFYVADDELEIAEDARKGLKESAGEVLDAALAALEDIDGSLGAPDGSGAEWTAERIEGALRAAVVDGLGIKPRLAFGPVRTAVSGQKVSPPLFESMEILGKESSMRRLRALRATL